MIFEILKSLFLKILDLFLSSRREKRSVDADIERFYTELQDIRELALKSLRILVSEHNRANDIKLRSARHPDLFGPAKSPQPIDIYQLKDIFQVRYQSFSAPERDAIRQFFLFTAGYNESISAIDLSRKRRYSDLPRGFSGEPIVTTACVVYISSKLCELRERYFVEPHMTGAKIVTAVLESYGLEPYAFAIKDVE